MVTFRLNRECREIAINPAKVLYVSHYETGASSIHFGKDCFVRVQGEMQEVIGRIDAALCDRAFGSSAGGRDGEPKH
jgi:hypothetical protein